MHSPDAGKAPVADVPLAARPSSPMRKGLVSRGGVASDLPYVKLIATLREYPTTEDFVYLKRMDQNASVYDPYALQVAPFSAVDQQDFYTMSVRGMTHYLDGVSADFASE